MARHPESSEPSSRVETQREGIMYEGGDLREIVVASRTLSILPAPTAQCPQWCCKAWSHHEGQSLTAKLRTMATFPRMTLVFQLCSYFNGQCTGVNYLVLRGLAAEFTGGVSVLWGESIPVASDGILVQRRRATPAIWRRIGGTPGNSPVLFAEGRRPDAVVPRAIFRVLGVLLGDMSLDTS